MLLSKQELDDMDDIERLDYVATWLSALAHKRWAKVDPAKAGQAATILRGVANNLQDEA